jgi:hypothetical protein
MGMSLVALDWMMRRKRRTPGMPARAIVSHRNGPFRAET